MQHFKGIIIAFVLLSVFTSYSAYQNRGVYLKSVGASNFSDSFARQCTRQMKRKNMQFRFGTPTPQYGCICVGVRMEKRYSAEVALGVDKVKNAYAAYMDYLANKEMHRPVHELAWNNKASKNMQDAIRDAFHYCDDFDLEGRKRVDLSLYPKHLLKRDDRHYLLSLPR